ncbi:unnamed protein product [Rotaria sordida]|uniref:DUF3638 domain-containing protein n=1 Tax=Rotaria sordida TaxID=392033 RepID=A0A814LH72_9BILA|nr:unnamed protein product [Rotaria sordida]
MNFELLPNEIILDSFEYLSLIHLYQSFFALNSRFNRLLCQQFQTFHHDLRLASKTNFHRVCQNYVLPVIDRIISLNLSNDDNTPQQIEHFLSHNYQLRKFICLKSISLSCLRSQRTLDQIMVQCSYLPCLTHLTLTDSHVSMTENDAQRLFDQIWSLSQLTYCYLDNCFVNENYFPNPTVISTSLRHLNIRNMTCSLSTLTRLCQCTLDLQYLSIMFYDDSDQLNSLLPILSITRLNICFESSITILQHLLQNMPNLYHLTIETYDFLLNGNQWKEMINKYLLKLKILQFKARPVAIGEYGEIQFNEILDSFRTKFWIDEHQWFVQCHLLRQDKPDTRYYIYVFTLPYAFKDFSDVTNCILSKSTRPYDKEYLTCDRVINLYYKSSHFTVSILSHVRFCNIQSLSLSLPFHDLFLSIVCRLDRLISLTISIGKNGNLNNIQSQLRLLLDRTVRLHSLRCFYWPLSNRQLLLMEITSTSVRRLDLQGYICDFDEEQCIQLSHSPLGIQCETLLIRVKNRRNILNLVNNMSNLQALNVQCLDDNWTDENDLTSSIDDELVEWLRQQLPSTYEILHAKYQLIYTVGSQQQVDESAEHWKTIQQILELVAKHSTDISKYFSEKVCYKSSERSSAFPQFRLQLTNDTQLLLPAHICQYDLSELQKIDAIVVNNLLKNENENYQFLPINVTY